MIIRSYLEQTAGAVLPPRAFKGRLLAPLIIAQEGRRKSAGGGSKTWPRLRPAAGRREAIHSRVRHNRLHCLEGSEDFASSFAFSISLEASSLALRSVITESSRRPLLSSAERSTSTMRRLVLTMRRLTTAAMVAERFPI